MLTPLQTTLLNSISCFLKGEKYSAPLDTDWNALFKESVEQAVALSCLQGLETKLIPNDVKKEWQNYAMRSLQTNLNVHFHHAYLNDKMTEANIPYVILKGSSSAYYYADSLMRAMGDVDFLVPQQVEKQVIDILKQDCWETDGKWEEHHVSFHKGKIELELHREPAGIPNGEIGKLLTSYFIDIYENSKQVEIEGNSFIKSSDFHHGLILLLHMQHHLVSGGLGLRQFCDWAAFVTKFTDESFILLFKEKLVASGLWSFAQTISYICYKYLGLTYCEWMGKQEEEFCELVMNAVLQGGNFGKKEGSKAVGTVLLNNKSQTKKRTLLSLIILANASGRINYPKLAKIPILKHFLFIPMGFIYVWQKITGKRKGKGIDEAMRVAEAKEQVYKQFKLFEVDENEY